jgi:flagellar basal body-associated protein FliL
LEREQPLTGRKNTISIAIIAIVAAIALLGVVVVTVAVTIPLQQAEAREGAQSLPLQSALRRDVASILSGRE